MKKLVAISMVISYSCLAQNFELVNKTDKKIYFGLSTEMIDRKTGKHEPVFSEVKRMLLPHGTKTARFQKTIDGRRRSVLYIWTDPERGKQEPKYEKWYPGKTMPEDAFFTYEAFGIQMNGAKDLMTHRAPKISPKPDQLYTFEPGKKIIINVTDEGIVPQKGHGLRGKKSRSGLSLEHNVTKADIKKIPVTEDVAYKPRRQP